MGGTRFNVENQATEFTETMRKKQTSKKIHDREFKAANLRLFEILK
jgi:hypothetical protein